jgi:hypothetical protein
MYLHHLFHATSCGFRGSTPVCRAFEAEPQARFFHETTLTTSWVSTQLHQKSYPVWIEREFLPRNYTVLPGPPRMLPKLPQNYTCARVAVRTELFHATTLAINLGGLLRFELPPRFAVRARGLRLRAVELWEHGRSPGIVRWIVRRPNTTRSGGNVNPADCFAGQNSPTGRSWVSGINGTENRVKVTRSVQ